MGEVAVTCHLHDGAAVQQGCVRERCSHLGTAAGTTAYKIEKVDRT